MKMLACKAHLGSIEQFVLFIQSWKENNFEREWNVCVWKWDVVQWWKTAALLSWEKIHVKLYIEIYVSKYKFM